MNTNPNGVTTVSYYLISTEYVGPNARNLDTDRERIVYGHYVDICDRPGRTNMSREERTEGWLGTTNDWSEYAHGEFDRLDVARAARDLLFPQTFERDSEADDLEIACDSDGNVIYALERRYVGAGENVWSVEAWAWDAAHDEISADTTDERLAELVAESEGVANSEGVILHGNLLEMFESIREDKRAEIDS